VLINNLLTYWYRKYEEIPGVTWLKPALYALFTGFRKITGCGEKLLAKQTNKLAGGKKTAMRCLMINRRSPQMSAL